VNIDYHALLPVEIVAATILLVLVVALLGGPMPDGYEPRVRETRGDDYLVLWEKVT
jgi:hypothetical protein